MLTSTVPHLSAAQILDRLGSEMTHRELPNRGVPQNQKAIHNFVIGNISDFKVVQVQWIQRKSLYIGFFSMFEIFKNRISFSKRFEFQVGNMYYSFPTCFPICNRTRKNTGAFFPQRDSLRSPTPFYILRKALIPA